MGNFLDKAGLGIVWGLIKNGFITKSSVQAKSTTLSWATETEIANIDGKSIKITLPSNPDTDNNTARLQISDTTNRKINTKESTAEYIQFTPGTNKFTVGDGTSSFDVPITISNDSHDHDSRYLKLSGGTLTGALTIDSNALGAVPHLVFTRHNYNYITVPDDGTLAIGIGSSGVDTRLAIDSTSVFPGYNNGTISLGTSNYYWGTVYGNSFVKKDGTSSQFLKADGSVDSNSYSTTSHTHQITVISGTKADGTTNITATSTAGTNPSVTLADSGVGAGTYGPTANVTNGSISIPCVQVNSKGIVTGLSTKTFTANVPTVYDGTLSIKTKVGNSETIVSSFSANQKTESPVSIVFQQGSNITLTPDATNKKITIDATDTTYTAGAGLTLDGTEFKHSNSISAKTAFGSTSTTASANNGTITVTDVQYDAQGHITKTTDRTITLSQDHTASGIQRPDGNWTAGTTEATQGPTIDVPYLKVNSAGHITSFGTHVHTVTGYADLDHTHFSLTTPGDESNVETTPNTYSNIFRFAGSKANSSIGNPSNNSYSYLIGLRGWADSERGNAHELAFNNSGIYRRSGATTSWGSWAKILDSANYTDYVNVTNFPGINKTGTVTRVAAGTGLAGGTITEQGTLSLATVDGLTADSYGPSENVNGTDGAELKVPYITVDAYGRVTSISNKTYTSRNSTYTVGEGKFKISANNDAAVNTLFNANQVTDATGINFKNGTAITASVTAATSSAPATVTFNHSSPNTLTSGTYGPANAITSQGTSLYIPYITVDAQGHVTSISNRTFSSTSTNNGSFTIKTKVGDAAAVSVSSTSANASGDTEITFIQGPNITLTTSTQNKTITIAAKDTTYSAGSGLTLDGTTFKHSNSITAATVGTSTASEGKEIQVPYITYDAQGHITATGTHKHTVTGFSDSGHNHNGTYLRLSGADVMTGDLTLNLGNNDRFIVFSYSGTVNPAEYSWRTGVLGTGYGNENYYVVQYQNINTSSATWNTAFKIGQDTGNVDFTNNIIIGGGTYTNIHSGNYTTYAATANHDHDNTYLKLSGGALANNQAVISRAGNSVLWVEGRDYPIIKTTSYTGYNAILSMKTTNGSWDLGVYSDDYAYLTYITDSNHSAGTNTQTYQLTFPKTTGTLATTSNIGSANLNLKVNGVANTSFSANATSAVDFNIGTGSASGTISVGGVNVTVKDIAGAAYKAVDTSITAGSSSTNVPTSQAVASLVSSALTSALIYKGTIGSSGADITALPASHKVGDVYVVAKAGTFAGKACEVGDYIICKTAGSSANDAHWNVVNGENQVENKSVSLAGAGSSATIATVDGTDITVTTPSTWTGLTKTGTITKVGTVTSGDVSVSSSNNTASFGNEVTVGSVGGVDLKFRMPGNPNTDVNVTQTVTTSSNTSFRPLLIGASWNDAATFDPATITAGTYATHLAKISPAAGELYLVGLKRLNTSGAVVSGSNTDVWNTNGGVTSLSSYLTGQDHYKTSPTSGSYGPGSDVTGSNGAELLVPYITVNEYGHVTSIVNKKYTSVDHTYTVNNGTYTIKTKVGDTVTSVSDFTANQSGDTDDVTFIAGTNVSLTPDATNRTITISSTDTNTHNSHGHTFTAQSGTALTPSHGQSFTVVTALGNASATTGNLTSNYTTQQITLPFETTLSKGTTTGTGNAVTDITVSGHTITLAKNTTFSVDGHTHNTVNAIYTQNGGQQPPNYFGTSRAGFLMSNVTVNGDSHYKNWIYVDAYGGNDVGGTTAIGVDRQECKAFIMQSDATRTSWNDSAEIITTKNVGSYSTSDTALTREEILAILT